MIVVNAHMGYYLNGTVFTRLKEDVIEPAKARGYDQIWLVGNSLGGYGSISYGNVLRISVITPERLPLDLSQIFQYSYIALPVRDTWACAVVVGLVSLPIP
ncbi:MAG: hypothetical protein ACM3MD_05175 [Betaproteobacteria bacterium]